MVSRPVFCKRQKKNSVVLVRKRTIPTERQLLVGEVINGRVRLHEVALRRCYNVISFEILTVVNILECDGVVWKMLTTYETT
jgi:hypothetical protein